MDNPRSLVEALYRTMVRIRFCEESLVEPILNREIRCPCHLYTGEEAVASGVCACLEKSDYLFGTHRSHGHFLAKGGSMKALLAEIYCREGGCSRGRGGSMHVIDPNVHMMGAAPIVAGTMSLAVGAALACQIRKDGGVVVSFFGDGATGEGVLYESLNFAALRKLPIIFACENNLYATHMPARECRVNGDIFRSAEPFGVEAHQVDGNDVLKVYEVAKQAVGKCRNDGGPVFIEFLTYRFRGHVGPDDNIQGRHADIRPKEEIERWLLKDPIKLFEGYLQSQQLIDERRLWEIREAARKEVKDAHDFCRSCPAPSEGELMKYVYR